MATCFLVALLLASTIGKRATAGIQTITYEAKMVAFRYTQRFNPIRSCPQAALAQQR